MDQDCDGADLTDVDADGHDAQEAGGDDCSDEDPSIHPGAHEVPYDDIDQDCDGADLVDVDGDGYASTEVGGEDCDDSEAEVSPDAQEVCNEVDDDCDGLVDTMVAGLTHATIAEAIDAACASGDEVLVAPGTYVENILWPEDKGLTLRSTDGPETTIVDGSDCVLGAEACSVFSIFEVADPVTLSGLTITGGRGGLGRIQAGDHTHDCFAGGGGILVNFSTLVVEACVVEANETNPSLHPTGQGFGGGICGAGGGDHWGHHLTITESTIRSNNAEAFGGGVFTNTFGLALEGSTVEDNTAYWGGGLMHWNIQRVDTEIVRNDITGNKAEEEGGGAWLDPPDEGRYTVRYNTFESNEAGTEGGGLYSGLSTTDFNANHERPLRLRSNVGRSFS